MVLCKPQNERKKCIPIDTILWTVLGIWMLAIFCSSLKNAILYVTVRGEQFSEHILSKGEWPWKIAVRF